MIESLQSGTREAVDVMERGQEMTGETVDQANKAGEALQRSRMLSQLLPI